jgi:lipid II:glycine glycyltransferase (peptidoglycan interpeptide bridge formation enzyme)
MFGKAHLSGSSASCPRDISSDDASDEDEDIVPKPVENVEKTRNTKKRKCKGASTGAEEKDEKSPFFRLYKSTCQKI